MNVVDSSGWLSYFAGEASAGRFAKAIEAPAKLLVPSISLTEVFKHVCRLADEESALAVVAHMQQGTVVELDSALAISAGHYGLAHKLPLADSIIYATARKFSATLWTQGRDFDGLPGVRFFPRVE